MPDILPEPSLYSLAPAAEAELAVPLPSTLDGALEALAARPAEDPAAPETHETQTPLADAWIGGNLRPPLREQAPVGLAGARRSLLFSAMH